MAIVATVAALLAVLALGIQIITIVARNDEQTRSKKDTPKEKRQSFSILRVEYDDCSLESGGDQGPSPLQPQPYPPPVHPPYELRPSPGKGLGAFATRWIPKHTRVLVEAPQFVIVPPESDSDSNSGPSSSPTPIANDILSQIQSCFNKLKPADQAVYEACHEHRFSGEPDSGRLFYIFRSNAFSIVPVDVLDSQRWGTRWGMFPQMARINHSCQPNMANLWAPGAGDTVGGTAAGHQLVWTTRDIAPGEELLISYVNLLQDTAARQQSLDQFGFQCDCSVCREVQSGNASLDERRVQVGDLLRRIQDIVVDGRDFRVNHIDSIDKLVHLLKSEDGSLAGYLPRAYRLAAALGHFAMDSKSADTDTNTDILRIRALEAEERELVHSILSTDSS